MNDAERARLQHVVLPRRSPHVSFIDRYVPVPADNLLDAELTAFAGPGDTVLDPDAHLRIAVPWLCGTLRAVTGHLAESGKPATALDAMLVCHVAGCSRVTGSASGVPQAGEAGCDERCAALIRRYLDAVQGLVRQYAATPPETPPEPSTPPAASPPSAGPAPVWLPAHDPHQVCTRYPPAPTGARLYAHHPASAPKH